MGGGGFRCDTKIFRGCGATPLLHLQNAIKSRKSAAARVVRHYATGDTRNRVQLSFRGSEVPSKIVLFFPDLFPCFFGFPCFVLSKELLACLLLPPKTQQIFHIRDFKCQIKFHQKYSQCTSAGMRQGKVSRRNFCDAESLAKRCGETCH